MAATCLRASSQGIGFTFPESTSAIRREISLFQASSISGSTAESKLSRRELAREARASGGRARAFFNRSEMSGSIAPFYATVRNFPGMKWYGGQGPLTEI